MIPEEMIHQQLDFLASNADPDSAMHHLHVVAAPQSAAGPLGLPDTDRLEVAVYAIAPTKAVDPELFTAKTVAAAGREHRDKNMVVLFAAIAQSTWAVDPMDDLGRRLMAEGRLFDHPRVADMSIVYAACRDGRRWRAAHWLSGPRAGTSEQVDLLVGAPQPGEGRLAAAKMIRAIVGLQ